VSTLTPQQKRPRRLALPVVLAGSVASLILALGLSPTISAFTAEIQNTLNTAGSGALIMQESNSDGSITCLSTDNTTVDSNSAQCTTINKYGGTLTMTPGRTVTTDINIANIGTADASSFTLTPESCSQPDPATGSIHGSATDLCSKMTLDITSGATTIYSGTLADFNTPVDVLTALGATSVAQGSTVSFSFAVTLPTGLDNSYAGLEVSQPLTWTFGAGS